MPRKRNALAQLGRERVARHQLQWLEERERSQQHSVTSPRLSLSEFFRQSWEILEPSTELLWNWHMDAMCLHSEALFEDWLKRRENPEYKQRMRNLVINVPPGSAKSRLVSVCLPAWIWTQFPGFKMIFLSANPRVALRDSVLCRDMIESEWYQKTFSPAWQIRDDQNTKSSFWNTAGGFRNAGGFNSRITGDRCDLLGWDDPHDAEEVNSETKRSHVIERWDAAIKNRVNSPDSSIRLGIMQRLHYRDLTGHVLDSGEWSLLRIPQEYDGDRIVTPIGWSDPRTELGELMFPARFSKEFVENEKRNSYHFAGQHQQSPVPREGGMIKLAWFQRYKEPPATQREIILSLDTASKASELSCPWVAGIWALKDGQMYLLYVLRKQMEYPEGKRTIINLMEKWSPSAVLIEDKSTGQSLIQEYRQGVKLSNGLKTTYNVIAIEPESDKVTRMSTESPAIEAGRVWLPETASWLGDYELELTTFPRSATADQVDMTSQLLKWVRTRSQRSSVLLGGMTK